MGESSSHLCFHQDVPREPEDPWEIPEASLRFPTWWLHSLLWASWEVAVVEFHPHPFPFKSHLIIFSYTSNKTSKTANHYRVPLSFWWSSIFGFVELRSKTALSLSWRCRTCRWGRDDERRRPWVKNCWNSPSEMGIPSTKKCEQNMKRHAHRISIFKVSCNMETSEPYEVSSNPSINLRLHSLCWRHIPVHFPVFPNLSKIT